MSRWTRRASKRTGFVSGVGVKDAVADGVATGLGDSAVGGVVVAGGMLGADGGPSGSGVHPVSRAINAAVSTAVRLMPRPYVGLQSGANN
jgi:hypothetical protein